ncbi:MAG TPA: signal peptidase II [Geminicoccaceae bacterium]|nr:signal peptidase II [Geminicoccaceae bacterium]
MVRLGLTVALLLLALDQLSKWIALDLLDLAARPITVTSFFNLVMVWNRGVSFGMLDSLGAFAPWLLSGVALAVVIGLLFWLKRSEHAMTAIGLGLVIGGAIGNALDRLRHGAVVDFLDFHLAGYHWPAFNLADAGICVGAGLIVVDGLLAPRRQYT